MLYDCTLMEKKKEKEKEKENIMALVFHVISQDHVTKESSDFTVGYLSAKLGGRRHCSSGDIMFLAVG